MSFSGIQLTKWNDLFQRLSFSSSGFPEWGSYTVRTFNKPSSETIFSISSRLLCLLTLTTLSIHLSTTNIRTPSDLSLSPIQNSLYPLLLAPKNLRPLPFHFFECMPRQLLCLPMPVLIHLLYLSVSWHSKYRPEIPSLSAVYQPLGRHEHNPLP